MAKEQLVNLGRAIKERREELGLSQTRLGAKIPVDPKTIGRWESGETGGAHDSLDQLAEALDTTPDALLARAVALGRENRPKPEGDQRPGIGTRQLLLEVNRKLDLLLEAQGITPPDEGADDPDGERPTPQDATDLAGSIRDRAKGDLRDPEALP